MTLEDLLAQARQKYAAGNLMDALMLLSEALHQKPNDRHILHARAHVFLSLNNTEQAERDLDALLGFYPEDAQGWDDRGVLYQRRNNYLKAAECHMKAANIVPADGIILNLAIAMAHLGQRVDAEKLYLTVLQINPDNTRAMTNLAVLHEERGQYDHAEAYLREAHQRGDTSFELYMGYGNVCRKLTRSDEALKWYQQALIQRPGNGPAAFLIALLKGDNPEAPPQEHIAGLFDTYADTFESSLIGHLKYRTPELLFDAAEKELVALKNKVANTIGIDLGAGTGLFGKILRPYLKTSIGLDLSSKMLDKAQEQHIYDAVLCMDMIDGLKKYPSSHFHVVSAADVLVYVGKLDALFQAYADALAPGGLLIFSTEANVDGEQRPYHARETGRYAHDESYLRKLIDTNGFNTVHFERTWIRYNKEKPLDGFIVVLKKPL